MRRKSIPAAAPVLISSEMYNDSCIEACLRTETLYLDNGNMLKEKYQSTTEQQTSSDVPSRYIRSVYCMCIVYSFICPSVYCYF